MGEGRQYGSSARGTEHNIAPKKTSKHPFAVLVQISPRAQFLGTFPSVWPAKDTSVASPAFGPCILLAPGRGQADSAPNSQSKASLLWNSDGDRCMPAPAAARHPCSKRFICLQTWGHFHRHISWMGPEKVCGGSFFSPTNGQLSMQFHDCNREKGQNPHCDEHVWPRRIFF